MSDINVAAKTMARAPQTHLQSRIEQELSLQLEIRGDAPDRMPELDREITMVSGALHGVEQRLGELIAKLRPVMDDKSFAQIMGEGSGVMIAPSDELAPRTDHGRRLREIQYSVTAVEHALSFVLQGVAL